MSSLENGLRILSLFHSGRAVVKVRDVGSELNLPKSSVSRLMASLADRGILERGRADTGYMIGPLALTLYDSYFKGRSLTPEFEHVLGELVAEFSFTGLASTLTEADIVLVNAKYGSHPLRIVQSIGQRLPAEDTVTGKCLLARLSDDEVRGRLAAAGRSAGPELFAVLQSIRESGFSWEASRRTKGIESIGAAIVSMDGDAVGFCLIYPAGDGAPVKEAMIKRVCSVAADVGARFGDDFWMRAQKR